MRPSAMAALNVSLRGQPCSTAPRPAPGASVSRLRSDPGHRRPDSPAQSIGCFHGRECRGHRGASQHLGRTAGLLGGARPVRRVSRTATRGHAQESTRSARSPPWPRSNVGTVRLPGATGLLALTCGRAGRVAMAGRAAWRWPDISGSLMRPGLSALGHVPNMSEVTHCHVRNWGFVSTSLISACRSAGAGPPQYTWSCEPRLTRKASSPSQRNKTRRSSSTLDAQ